jgi:hypothetical protein
MNINPPLSLGLIATSLLLPFTGITAAEPSPPNLVVFLTDDTGWGDIACYGNRTVSTPNVDKLASEGVRFTQGYSSSGVCSPSRSAILTGRTPYRNGVWKHLPPGNDPAHLRTSGRNLAGEMPEKLDEMKKTMVTTWTEIEAEGPSEWWLKSPGTNVGEGDLNY